MLITTKLPGRGHGRRETRACLSESLERLGVDDVDVDLIHWPLPTVGRYVESWETDPPGTRRLVPALRSP